MRSYAEILISYLQKEQKSQRGWPDFAGGEGGIRTLGTRLEYGSLANYWFKPLTHLTVKRVKDRKVFSYCQHFFRKISKTPVFYRKVARETLRAQSHSVNSVSSIQIRDYSFC